MKKPNFNNLLKVLEQKSPDRPTLFEFFLNEKLYQKLAGKIYNNPDNELERISYLITAFKNAGYDYTTASVTGFNFPAANQHKEETISINDAGLIKDKNSFKKYSWPDPDKADYSILDRVILPEGMKLIIHGPMGVLENVVKIVGYENLCYLTIDQPELVQNIFNEVGSRLLRYYENCLSYNSVGAIIGNDDWGFNTQTMISPEDMKKYVFPWHKKIVNKAHQANKPAILHSCGNLENIMDIIIDDLKYDGKHSFEDNIIPVEKAYERWGNRIAILGGIDLNFICTASPIQITERSLNMLKKADGKGSYALGTGNSVPEYVPEENYFAMIKAVKLL